MSFPKHALATAAQHTPPPHSHPPESTKMVTIEEAEEDDEELQKGTGKDAHFTVSGEAPPSPPLPESNRSSPPPPEEDWNPESPLSSSVHTSHASSSRVDRNQALTSSPKRREAAAANVAFRQEAMAVVAAPDTKVEPGDGFSDGAAVEDGVRGLDGGGGSSGGGGGSGWWTSRTTLSILRRAKRENMVRKAALGLRVCGFALCLISFSVMAADRNKGWAFDSFDRYKEFRYCISVTVIAAGYSGLQLYHLLMDTQKIFPQHLRCYFDFLMDQILTYLLLSASSSAAIRVDDWKSNWGPDRFPEMASAAVGVSFVAFAAFALSSLISGYTLSTFIRS